MKTQSFRFGALVLTILILEGCVLSGGKVGPDYKTPKVSLPSRWSIDLLGKAKPLSSKKTEKKIALRQLSHWWRQWGDPQLNQLIDKALANNLDLRLAQSRLRQARASRRQEIGKLFPMLSVSTEAIRNKPAKNTSALPTNTLYDAGFDASWEMDLFGGRARGIEAATADEAAQEANLNNTRVSLVAEIAQNYIDLRAAQIRAKIAQETLASQTETAQITQWRYQSGLAASREVEQARVNCEQARASRIAFEVSKTALENQLAVLLGRNPGSLHRQFIKVRPLPPLPPSIGTGIPADALLQRPDLIAAERILAAETARVGQTLAKRFPSLNLATSFGWQAYSFSALGAAVTVSRSVSGTLATTLFDGGQLRRAVEIQTAVQEQALISYQNSVLTALEEIENGLKSYAAGRDQIKARQAAVTAARNAARLTQDRYQSGLDNFLTFLAADRTRLSAEDSLAASKAALQTSLITLYKALGGGWEPRSNIRAKR